jgi:hypothetical protein
MLSCRAASYGHIANGMGAQNLRAVSSCSLTPLRLSTETRYILSAPVALFWRRGHHAPAAACPCKPTTIGQQLRASTSLVLVRQRGGQSLEPLAIGLSDEDKAGTEAYLDVCKYYLRSSERLDPNVLAGQLIHSRSLTYKESGGLAQ